MEIKNTDLLFIVNTLKEKNINVYCYDYSGTLNVINSIVFEFENNIYWIELKYKYLFSVSSRYKPSKWNWSGSNILDEWELNDVLYTINNLPKNYYIWDKKTPPVFYSSIEEYKKDCYFNLINL